MRGGKNGKKEKGEEESKEEKESCKEKTKEEGCKEKEEKGKEEEKKEKIIGLDRESPPIYSGGFSFFIAFYFASSFSPDRLLQ